MRHASFASPGTGVAGRRGGSDLDIAGVASDSRAVMPGDLFVALPGARHDGRAFIADAVARGAAAVLAPQGTPWPPGVPPRPLITDENPRRRLAQFASVLAGRQPSTLVGVTGTNGKTSTVEFLRQLWALDGSRAASLGTLGLVADGAPSGPGLTTPDPVSLFRTLADLAAHGTDRVAMEVSSHGLAQYRVDGARFSAAGFTNLTRDHLDYHGTEAAYRAAKLRLFSELLPRGAPAVAVSGMDPESLRSLAEIARARSLELATVGAGGSAIDLLSAVPLPDGQELELRWGQVRSTVRLALPGLFQAHNALMAAALAAATGMRDPLRHLPALAGVRGRMELAARGPGDRAVYVDYAHTPDALERLLTALRPHTRSKLHVVFGAGGDRDRGKRPLMGEVAGRLADRVIVTDDNPRTEDPVAIRAAVVAACPGARDIGGRETAIAAALSDLGPGDVLAVAGKGHEQGQTIGTETIPFDDVSVVRRLMGLT